MMGNCYFGGDKTGQSRARHYESGRPEQSLKTLL